jgi:cytidylate kinase
MTKIYTIAIDGDSAAGKGTLARALAAALDFAYLDTGLLYRRTGFNLLKENREITESTAAAAAAMVTLADLAEPSLRSDEVAQMASKVAVFAAVRQALLPIQHNFIAHPPGGKRGAVLDGRDIGTVICPSADIKFYVTADPAIRAYRRQKELQDSGITATTAQVLDDMLKRDTRDRTRSVAPTQMAEDAWPIDTSGQNPQTVLSQALAIVYRAIPQLAKQ